MSRRWVGQIGSGGVSDASTTTVPLSSVTNLPTDTGVCVVIDRVDANGTSTPNLEETVYGVVSGTNLVSCSRGVEGTAQSHASGAVVEVLDAAALHNGFVTGLTQQHNQDGTHKSVTTDTLDATGAITGVSSGSRSATASFKQASGVYQDFQSYSPTAAGTATLDLALGNHHRITMPAGNITIALSHATTGQKFLIDITQDSVGSRTVTFFTTIKWVGGSAPTLTTTANKRDCLGFIITGSNTYDGFVVGQNI